MAEHKILILCALHEKCALGIKARNVYYWLDAIFGIRMIAAAGGGMIK